MLLRRMAGFARERGGNIAVTFALASPALVGAAGLGVETSYWYMERNRMQAAADASAYSAAMELRASGSETAAVVNGKAQAGVNGVDLQADAIDVVASRATGRVDVTAARSLERSFSKLFDDSPLRVNVRASALFEVKSKACILALNPTTGRAAQVSGSAQVTLIGCSVMANSTAADAVRVQGSSAITTPCLISSGGVVTTSGVKLTSCDAPIVNAPAAADPFQGLARPANTGACQNAKATKLQPGRYCNGLSLSGNVLLDPGVYVISGDLKINANTRVRGSGVTLYLTNGGRVGINGTATVELSAPTSGTYAGVLFFNDPLSGGGQRNTFNGTANSHFQGAIYAPSQAVEYLGNFSGDNGCVQVVADTVEWTGSTSVKVDCSALGMRDIPVYTTVRVSA